MRHKNNWARQLNDPRMRVSVLKRVNRQLPWLKVVLTVVFLPTVLVLLLAWRIWLDSPNAQRNPAEGVTGETEELQENEVELYSTISVEKRTTKEIVDRAEIKVWQKSGRYIPEGKALVALTFDDGPSGMMTPKLLDVLRDHQAVATFFMLGRMARANPSIVKRAAAEGHEVASHTMHHQNLIRISANSVQADVDEANQVFRNILGAVPRLTRPPYGNYNATVARIVNTPLINWTVDTNDWRAENRKNPWNIYRNAVNGAFDGAIILMHDIYPTTIDKVGVIVDELKNRGYELVTVSELAAMRGVELKSGVEYSAFRP